MSKTDSTADRPDRQVTHTPGLPFRCRIAQAIRQLSDDREYTADSFTVDAIRVQIKTESRWPHDDPRPQPVLDAIVKDVLERHDAYKPANTPTPASPANNLDSPGDIVAANRGDDA